MLCKLKGRLILISAVCLILGLSVALVPGFSSANQEQEKAAQPAAQDSGHEVLRDSLLNGLKIMVIPKPGTGAVSLHLRINKGALFDLASKGGLAYLTAQMLPKGGRGLQSGGVQETLQQFGLAMTVQCGWDSTDIMLNGPAASVESMFDLLSRLVVTPSFDPTEFASVKTLVQNETGADSEAAPDQTEQRALAILYSGFPYGHPARGTKDSVGRIIRDDLRYYHDRYYLPDDSELVVRGAITPEEVTRLARSMLGTWPKAEVIPATFIPPQKSASRRIALLEKPGSEAEAVLAQFGVSRMAADYFPVRLAALLLNERLAQGSTSTGCDIKSEMDCRYLGGTVLVKARGAAGRLADAVQLIVNQMEQERSAEIGPVEMDRAKQALTSQLDQLATDDDGTALLLDMEEYKLGHDYMLNYRKRISAVTPDQVKQAASKYFDTASAVLVIRGPAALADSLRKFGQVAVEQP